ncbi:MAG: choice-of-anchor J domain-containing protein, partial [Crocinitomicaceae bacterium]
TLTGEAIVRVTRGGVSDESDDAFSIAALITGQTITQVCPTTVTFSWNADPDAESYDVYVLGTEYMEVVGNSTTNTYTHTITDPTLPIWYAIAGKNATNDWEGRRSIASYFPGGLLNCAFATDVELAAINNSPDFLSPCNTTGSYPEIQIQNSGTSPISNFDVSYELTGQPVVTEVYAGTLNPGQQASYTFTTPVSVTTNGTYTLTCTANVAGDGYIGNNSQMVDIFVQVDGTVTPFVEDFQATGFLPTGWSLNNPDNDDTWEEESVTGSNGSNTDAAYVNNYSYNAVGEEDYFETELFMIGGGVATLTFDLAKVQYSNTYKDSLAVQISDDCGASWTTIYAKGSDDIETANTSTSNWSPSSANDWRNEVVDISSYLGSNVSFRFINITGYGNGTYIDNINVMSDLSIGENDQVHFSLFPNPTKGLATLAISNPLDENSKVVITNQVGQVIQELTDADLLNQHITIDLNAVQSGVYYITVYTNDLKTTKRIVKN